jgi:malate dehydrogenase
MKISIIGAGNVGSTTALRLAQANFGEIVLLDKVPGLAQGKAYDLEDARYTLKSDYNIRGSENIEEIKKSDIVVVTAGLPRKPGMTREELLAKNADILKDICLNIKRLSPEAILIIVTNPLDLMTYLALKLTGFKPAKVLGMGLTLDAARFANLISKELNIPNTSIEAAVIASHGEGMLPLPRFTTIKGLPLQKFLDEGQIKDLIQKTIQRGAEIVSLLGSGSAYFAPSAAIANLVEVIVKDEKRTLGLSAYLNGEYGVKDLCLGVPCRVGKKGIEKIIELELNQQEKEAFLNSAEATRKNLQALKSYGI